jgi:hypothetical protein
VASRRSPSIRFRSAVRPRSAGFCMVVATTMPVSLRTRYRMGSHQYLHRDPERR